MDITQPAIIPVPWAQNGSKQNPIPEEQTSAGNGRASWKTGFPPENTLPVSQGGVPANYQDFQGVLHTLSEFACYQQAGGIFTYTSSLDYQPGARVLGSDGKVYRALAKNGPATVVATPVGDSSGKWILEPNLAQTSSAALDVASNYVTSGGYTINDGITVSGGITGSITSAQYASKIGTSTTTIGGTAVPVYVSGGAVTSCTTADLKAGKDGAGNVITSTYVDNTTYSAGMAEKANIDGYYDGMTVGNAEQLISNDYTTDSVPYNFRTAGGDADIGDREYDELVGGTIVWNQLNWDNNTFSNWSASPTASREKTNDTLLITALEGATVLSYVYLGGNQNPTPLIAGHKYLYCAVIETSNTQVRFQFGYSVSTTNISTNTITANTKTTLAGIVSAVEGSSNALGIAPFNGTTPSVGDTATLYSYEYFDLTRMFGTAIADHVYALETNNAGDGVAWFQKLFPKPYYQYNAGTLMSVNASSHNTVGFNALDLNNLQAVQTTQIETITNIPVVGGQAYRLEFQTVWSGNKYVREYDAAGNMLKQTNMYGANSAQNITMQPTTVSVWLQFAGKDLATIKSYLPCLHLKWSGYRDGEYEAYDKHTYPLDSSLTLRGVPLLDASNNLVYDGDTYAADGTVTRRYASVDLGTLTWTAAGTEGHERYQSPVLSPAILNPATVYDVPNIVCTKYLAQPANSTNNHLAEGIAILSGQVIIYTPEAIAMSGPELKASLSGIYLVYELATPTTETADPFQSPQIVSDFGTEQYVDAAVAAGTRDVAIPVGHETKYIANLVDKLRRLPDAPETAGNYLVHYDATTRRMSCTEYLDGSKVTALEGKVPDAPTTDGTYVLTATVADGTATYSWEVQA